MRIWHVQGRICPCGASIKGDMMEKVLRAFIQWMLDTEIPYSTFKKRMSAVIWIHKTGNISWKRPPESFWKLIKHYSSQHKSKPKIWLNSQSLSDLDERAWRGDSGEEGMTVIYEMVRETLFRPTSTTLASLSDSKPRFHFELIKWEKDFEPTGGIVESCEFSLKEKIKNNPNSTVRIIRWPLTNGRRGLANALIEYGRVNARNCRGPIKHADGSPITVGQFRATMVKWGKEVGIPTRVLPSVIRRSTIKDYSLKMPYAALRYMARHLSESTASKYYLHLDPSEVSAIRNSANAVTMSNSAAKAARHPSILPVKLLPLRERLRHRSVNPTQIVPKKVTSNWKSIIQSAGPLPIPIRILKPIVEPGTATQAQSHQVFPAQNVQSWNGAGGNQNSNPSHCLLPSRPPPVPNPDANSGNRRRERKERRDTRMRAKDWSKCTLTYRSDYLHFKPAIVLSPPTVEGQILMEDALGSGTGGLRSTSPHTEPQPNSHPYPCVHRSGTGSPSTRRGHTWPILNLNVRLVVPSHTPSFLLRNNKRVPHETYTNLQPCDLLPHCEVDCEAQACNTSSDPQHQGPHFLVPGVFCFLLHFFFFRGPGTDLGQAIQAMIPPSLGTMTGHSAKGPLPLGQCGSLPFVHVNTINNSPHP